MHHDNTSTFILYLHSFTLLEFWTKWEQRVGVLGVVEFWADLLSM